MAKYDKIGIGYNQTRKADPFIAERFFFHLKPKQGQKFVDIGCGTGNYAIALNGKGLDFTGIDPSDEMLKTARTKSDGIEWIKGKAEDIPMSNESVDGIIGMLTIHHWSDLEQGFKELFRILKPQGMLVIFTSTPRQMQGYWLNYYFPKMLHDSIIQMPALADIKSKLKIAGFEFVESEKYFVKKKLQDQFLYAGKHDPAFYLNEMTRKGISSFSSLANETEVEKGLHSLEMDILNQKIIEIIKEYKNDYGDYSFIIATKQA